MMRIGGILVQVARGGRATREAWDEVYLVINPDTEALTIISHAEWRDGDRPRGEWVPTEADLTAEDWIPIDPAQP